MNHFLVALIFTVFTFFVQPSLFAEESFSIKAGLNFKAELIDELASWGLFDEFHSGDDGFDCDYPFISLKMINYETNTMHFVVGLEGAGSACYEIYYNCELKFSYNKEGSLKIINEPLLPSEHCHYL